MSVSDVMVVVGTRPDTIKMAPVVKALQARPAGRTVFCVTAQHREMLDQVLEAFELRPDIDLDLMEPNQDLAGFMSRALPALRDAIRAAKPQAVLVHGDTSTCLAGTLAAFYERVPVGHVEAGLRTYDFDAPWPEEMNRRLVDPICRWCFAPTEGARANLLAERVPAERVFVTGNTAIDALLMAAELVRTRPPQVEGLADLGGQRLVLVTGHRRESFGPTFESMCLGLRDIADGFKDVMVVYPVHLNPNVQAPVRKILGDHPRVRLLPPQGYLPFVWLMDRAHLIVTDSGGIQEEAPSLKKPVLVMREVTERPEGIKAGVTRLVGTSRERIAEGAAELLSDEAAYRRMASGRNPYGDGKAAARIVEILSSGTSPRDVQIGR